MRLNSRRCTTTINTPELRWTLCVCVCVRALLLCFERKTWTPEISVRADGVWSLVKTFVTFILFIVCLSPTIDAGLQITLLACPLHVSCGRLLHRAKVEMQSLLLLEVITRKEKRSFSFTLFLTNCQTTKWKHGPFAIFGYFLTNLDKRR